MKRRGWFCGIAGLALGFGLIAYAGQAQSGGAGERIGEDIDKAFQNLKEQFSRAKQAVNGMGIEARVYGRLHWDQALNGVEDFDIRVRDHVAVLRGTVPTAEARAKAVMLARETVGVSQVDDQLIVSAPPPASHTP